jgi:hypothetical protein
MFGLTTPDSVNYVSGTIPFWKAYTEAEDFDFKLYDDSKTKVLLAKEVKKKHVDISELLKLLQPGKVYYWSATVKVSRKIKTGNIFTILQKTIMLVSLIQLNNMTLQKPKQR